MPTSYGKLLVYEILPYLDDVFCQSKLSAVLVVTPLNAIIDEQIHKLGQLQQRMSAHVVMNYIFSPIAAVG